MILIRANLLYAICLSLVPRETISLLRNEGAILFQAGRGSCFPVTGRRLQPVSCSRRLPHARLHKKNGSTRSEYGSKATRPPARGTDSAGSCSSSPSSGAGPASSARCCWVFCCSPRAIGRRTHCRRSAVFRIHRFDAVSRRDSKGSSSLLPKESLAAGPLTGRWPLHRCRPSHLAAHFVLWPPLRDNELAGLLRIIPGRPCPIEP